MYLPFLFYFSESNLETKTRPGTHTHSQSTQPSQQPSSDVRTLEFSFYRPRRNYTLGYAYIICSGTALGFSRATSFLMGASEGHLADHHALGSTAGRWRLPRRPRLHTPVDLNRLQPPRPGKIL